MEKEPVSPASSVLGPVMVAATVGGWFTLWTVMSRVPCTLPPCPSETVTRSVYVPSAVTSGAVQRGVGRGGAAEDAYRLAGAVWVQA